MAVAPAPVMRSAALVGVAMGMLAAGCGDSLSEIARPTTTFAAVATASASVVTIDPCETAFATHCAEAVESALVDGDDRRAETLAWKGCGNAVHACSATADVLAHHNPVAAHRLYESACARGDRAACRHGSSP